MQDLYPLIREIPDFPKPGILFRDITPLLASPPHLAEAIAALAAPFEALAVSKVVGMESRGFLFGTPVALRLGAGFVPVRKPGKLPGATRSESYALEYGTDRLEIHEDGIQPGERVLLVDDLLATGGTALAATRLVRALGGEVVGAAFLIELAALGGRALLDLPRVVTLLSYA
ncbi:MAG: adenine phosphoribosyltransferase [Myxococcota bacterium]|jgi:adenine phosphoribosyltransferase|nr:adenine phosphoribosyltransferase [Myxococcota bacterium]